MRAFAGLAAATIGSAAFQMSVDAGWIHRFEWATPWAWALCLALWVFWGISHPKVTNGALKSFHARLGRSIHALRLAVVVAVFVVCGLLLRAEFSAPADGQRTTSTGASEGSVSSSAAPSVQNLSIPRAPAQPKEGREAGLKRFEPPGSITQGPGSAFSINQQGGITAGTINNYAPPQRTIPPEGRAECIALLSETHGRVSVNALLNDAEGFKYAREWYALFKASDWEMADNQVRTLAVIGEPPEGLEVRFHGERPTAPAQKLPVPPFLVPLATCIAKLKTKITGNPFPDMKQNEIFFIVGTNPQ